MSIKSRTYAVIVLLLAALVYGNSLGNGFVWDDEHLILDNPTLKSEHFLRDAFLSPLFVKDRIGRSYRPLQALSYKIDLAIAGRNPAYLRTGNIFLHALNAFLIFCFLQSIGAHRITALFTPLIFLVHPVNVAAVSYVSGRADPLSLLFLLGALHFSLRYLRSSGPAPAAIGLIVSALFLLSLFARESALIFAVAAGAAALIMCPSEARRLRPLGFGLAVVIVFYAAFRYAALHELGLSPAAAVSFQERVLVLPVTWLMYLGHLLFPARLSLDYFLRHAPFHPFILLAGWAALPVMPYLFWTLVKKSILGRGLYVFWIVSLALYSNLVVYLNAPMADHWLYFPQIGFFGALIEGLRVRLPEKRARVVSQLCVVFITILSLRAADYNRVWKDPVTLNEYIVRVSPESPRPLYNLAVLYAEQGRQGEALNLLDRSIKNQPRPESYLVRANVYRELGEWALARADLERSVELDPGFAKGWANLGAFYLVQGDRGQATACLERALVLDPSLDFARDNLRAARSEGLQPR